MEFLIVLKYFLFGRVQHFYVLELHKKGFDDYFYLLNFDQNLDKVYKSFN